MQKFLYLVAALLGVVTALVTGEALNSRSLASIDIAGLMGLLTAFFAALAYIVGLLRRIAEALEGVSSAPVSAPRTPAE